jgi:fused signal recognition particle receptor
MGVFDRFKKGLGRSRENLVGKVAELFTGRENYSPEVFESLEELLIESDLGVDLSLDLAEKVETRLKKSKVSGDDIDSVLTLMRDTLRNELEGLAATEEPAQGSPHVIFLVGVNGVGKTTTAAKLARHYQSEGKTVLMAAADTFRAAAVEQLGIWAERLDCDMVGHQSGADPSAVIYDALSAARSRGRDVVLVDTAGRLHNKAHLMEELSKMRRVAAREDESAPHEVLLVLDANTGQNGIQQARVFKEATDLTGLVLAKLDGTAKGGVVLSIGRELGVPVRYVGLGEGLDDLEPFDPELFAEALLARE